METNQKISEWEKQQGIMFLGDDVKPNSKITASKFRELTSQNNHVAVNHAERTQFLEDNGYEVTRENLLDFDLEPQRKSQQRRKAASEKKETK